jgi:hypothetical protein
MNPSVIIPAFTKKRPEIEESIKVPEEYRVLRWANAPFPYDPESTSGLSILRSGHQDFLRGEFVTVLQPIDGSAPEFWWIIKDKLVPIPFTCLYFFHKDKETMDYIHRNVWGPQIKNGFPMADGRCTVNLKFQLTVFCRFCNPLLWRSTVISIQTCKETKKKCK